MPVVAVACSGGRDSTALLHCTARQARALGVQVVALHVHHGLMPEADAWLARVRGQARRWGVGFLCERLQGQPQRGESVEAWARTQRYAALARLAAQAGAPLVLLAHHRQDQAETWLLQALRGAGAAGLAAMPREASRSGITWARPWLAQPRSAIEAYARSHRLRWVDDASNADPRFARSRLRTAVWPVLEAAFPGADGALAAAASHAQDAAALMAELAARDLPPLCDGNALLLAPWQQLSPARRTNALRAWLQQRLGQPAPQTLVTRLLHELPGRCSGHWPAPGGASLRLYRQALRLAAPEADASSLLHCLAAIDLQKPGLHPLPGAAARLRVQAVQQGGIALPMLAGAHWRLRTGGERFQHAPRSTARSLKKQFQAAAVPAWQRQAPLLCAADGRVLFVPGLGVDARCLARPGEAQHLPCWEPLAQPTGHGQPPA